MTKASAGAWRCSVCGYVHREGDPPEWCPVCGAARSEFEAYAEAPHEPAGAVERWRCLNCNYVHAGPEPPDQCPVCAAPRDRFEPLAAEPRATAEPGRATSVLVVGAGIAGISAVESLRRASPQARISLISKETHLPYYRLNLTRYLAGEIDEPDLPIHPAEWYQENNIELLLGTEVASIALDERAVVLRDATKLPFEKLVLTVGSHPFIPPVPGAGREGVTALRSVGDAKRILAGLRTPTACACIGGGLLGIETAAALARRGADVTLLEAHDWLMPRQLNKQAAQLLAEHVENAGIKLRLRARTEAIVGDERAAGVLLEDGTTVPADLVVLATGVRPNSHLARRAGLEVNHGVVVDNLLASSHGDVLAAGDVAEHRGTLYGNWSASQSQGAIAGMNAAGGRIEFGGIPRSNTLKVLGLDLMSIGQFQGADGSFQVVEDQSDGEYFRFVFHDGRLVGSILLGETSVAGAVKKAIEGRRDFSGVLKRHPTASDIADHLAAR